MPMSPELRNLLAQWTTKPALACDPCRPPGSPESVAPSSQHDGIDT